jgi:glycosyltransferase involved in cell wall biosynthesis
MRWGLGEMASDTAVRVLFVWGIGGGIGGTENRMSEVASCLRERGLRVASHLLTADLRSPLAIQLKASGSEVTGARNPLALLRAARKERATHIMTFGLRASLVVRLLRCMSKQLRRATVIDARNGLEAGRGGIAWALDRLTHSQVDVYLANSDAVAALLRDRGIPNAKIAILYSAIPSEWNAPATSRPRPGTVAMVGNWRPEKRHDLGLEAFARVRTPASLTVYTNDGDQIRASWAQWSSEAQGTLDVVEGQNVTPALLSEYAILLHPSSHESASRAVIEARARGCFVVAFDVGDTQRLVEPGGGFLATYPDVVSLADALDSAVHRSFEGTLSFRQQRAVELDDYADQLLSLPRRPTVIQP